LELEFNLGRDAVSKRLEEQPFKILILGNFGGNAAGVAAPESIAERRIAPVDFDQLESLWELFSPRLQLGLGLSSIAFDLRDIDDFHPDHLYTTLPVFDRLRATRKALLDPRRCARTLASASCRIHRLATSTLAPRRSMSATWR
jgi:predicted component of type VI protein secretion system